jgi:uncharacterized protein YecE (DUF72 family)
MSHQEKKRKTSPVVIGMGGWELPPFYGVFYPTKPEKGFRTLEFYSRYFDFVEVNATFYNVSFTAPQVRRWIQDVHLNKNFSFTVKLYRGFTHTFDATKNDALAVHRLLEPLREAKLFDGLVIQFPSSFYKTREKQTYLRKLRTAFSDDRLFLDLRNKSWNDNSFYDFCRENGFILINVDLPHLPHHIPLNSFAWDGIAYFRMMGRNAEAWNDNSKGDRYFYPYNDEELHDLTKKIKNLQAKKTYVVFHNDRQAFSLVNGRQVEHALHPQKQLYAPTRLLETFPQLKTFCHPTKENETFF